MQALILFSACILAVSSEGKQYPCFKRGILECVEESKVSTQLVLQVTSGNWKVRDDYRLKEWAKCLLIKSKMMSKNGVLQLDVAMAGVADHDKSAVESLIDQCLYNSPHTPEETAWHFLKCYHERKGTHLQWCCEYEGKRYSCFRRHILECTLESKVNWQIVKKLMSGNWDVQVNYRLKQWAKCLLLRSKFMSKGGVFQLDVALATIPKRDKFTVEALIDQCLYTTPQKLEDLAWFFLKCYHTNDPLYTFI